MKQLLCLLFWVICCFDVGECHAQSDTCVTRLKDAQTDLDQGDYDEAITYLTDCLQHCPLSRSDRISAYKNLILCYLSIDNLEGVNDAAQHIMKLDPAFVPDKFRDDSRLVKVFEKYKPVPMFDIGVSVGINKPQLTTGALYSVVYPDGQQHGTYKTNIGFQLGMQAERRIFKAFWIEAAFSYRSSSYQHSLDSVLGANIDFTEKITYCDLPVSLKYYFHVKKVTPYVQAGVYFSFIAGDLSTTTNTNGLKDIVEQAPYRNIFATGYFGAAGVTFKLKSFILFANARYIIFPENVNKEGTRYSDQVNLFKYNYVDDDFKLDNTQINIGASFILSYKNK